MRSAKQATRIFTAITDDLAKSSVPELQTFRNTLMRWRREVLAYWQTRATNGMTEGFNGKAKLGLLSVGSGSGSEKLGMTG